MDHPTAVTERGEETRRRILDVAGRSFAEYGYQGTSFSHLVAATGLTKGAFYFHFASKEALALAAFAHAQERWVTAVVRRLPIDSPAADRLRSLLRAAVRFYKEDPAGRCVFRLCLELGEDPRLRPTLAPHLALWEDLVESLVRLAQEQGDYRADLDPRVVARVAVAAFVGVTDVARAMTGGQDLARRAEEFLHVFESGLRRTGRERA